MPLKRPLTERFRSSYQSASNEECWVWRGAHDHDGYGVIANEDGRQRYAHRVAYEMAFGPIPPNLLVLHHCDNPPCVNPSHLWVGTHDDNQKDKKIKGRGVYHRGSLHHNSKLTETAVREIRSLYPQMSQSAIAKRYNVCRQVIGSVLSRNTWKQVLD